MNSISIYPPGCKDIQTELANDELIRRLKVLDQSADEKYKELAVFLGSEFFLEHHHEDIQLLVACCLADIFRIYAPDSPFSDPNNLKNIFMFLANQLKGLKDSSNAAFKRYFYLLENLECVKTFLICQELDDSQEIIVNLFENVFRITNDKTSARVKPLLFELLNPLLNDADQISTKVLDILFARIIEPAKSNNREAYSLAVNLLKRGGQHFEYLVQNHLNSILLTSRSLVSQNLTISHGLNDSSVDVNDSNNSDEMSLLNNSLNEIAGQSSEAAKEAGVHGSGSSQFITDKLCLIIYELNTIRPALLELVMPQLEYKLKSNNHKERREYTRLLSKMFSEKDSKLAVKVPQLWEAYLERFADMNEDIRKICIQHISDFLIQQAGSVSELTSSSNNNISATAGSSNLHHHHTAPMSSAQVLEQIIEQVRNRSLDPDEALRHEVIQEILKAIKSDANLISSDLLNILQKRTLDVKIKIRKAALQGLAHMFKKVHAKHNSRKIVRLHNWIPSTIMKIYFQDSIEDKLMVERLLNSCIVPYSLAPKEKMAQLYYAFTTFDDFSVLSLVEIMKNRLLLYQLMKSIVELSESADKSPETAVKLEAEVAQVASHLMDVAKGGEFLKVLIGLFKKNLNLKSYFKSFVNLGCSCAKTMQLIQLIFTNMNTLSAAQMGMGKRLIERMSSLIIDRECLEKLIDLVEYKIRQKLTPEQRRMLRKRKNHGEATKKVNRRGKKATGESDSDEDACISSSDDELDEESQDDLRNPEANDEDGEDEDYDDNATNTTDVSSREDSENNFRSLLKHIDDDGEKGLKLVNTILLIHQNYNFANPVTYAKLSAFVNSRKENIVSASLKMLSHHFTSSSRLAYTADEQAAFRATSTTLAAKLKYLALKGKPKQVKYALYVTASVFDKADSDQMLQELYMDLMQEAETKNPRTFVTCLIGLGHLAVLIPGLVAKEMKEFVVKTIAKELLLAPACQPLNVSAGELSTVGGNSHQKRKNSLKLAGKWCENEEELPFNTLARIEGVKLLTRWCLGLKSECTNIATSIRLLTKLIKDNSVEPPADDAPATPDDAPLPVTEPERSRLRSVCGNQLLKLAQETAFKPLITAECFHVLARLLIDPVANVRDILIKKLSRGLQSMKLPIYYMAMFALNGLDSSRERRARIKKIYASLIARIRAADASNQKKQIQANVQRARILPEMCLPYAVSLLAHNTQIDTLKEDAKVKQVKECMSVILEPLIEKPDSWQVAYIKKILNKIKTSDDGLAAATITAISNSSNQSASMNKAGIHNLYSLNKKLCLICEIFLFHMHSKATTYLTAREYEFDVKLPAGFYAVRDVGSEASVRLDRFDSDERMAQEAEASSRRSSQSETEDLDKENMSGKEKKSVSKITITSRKRPSAENVGSEPAERAAEKKGGSPPAKRNKAGESSAAGRRSQRKASPAGSERVLEAESGGEQEAEEEATIGSMASKKDSPKKKKEATSLSPKEAKSLPVRASTRSTRASAAASK